MFISWDPPYTLPGLTVQYIISVGTEQHELISYTNYTYCPLNLTNEEYQFNISTSNKAGSGPTSNITVGFQSGIYFYSIHDYFYRIHIPEAYLTVSYNHNSTYLIGNEWVFSYQIKVSVFVNHYYALFIEPSTLYSTCCNGDSDQL